MGYQGVYVHYVVENLDLEFRRDVTGHLDEETINAIQQLKPWESKGLDRKQGNRK